MCVFLVTKILPVTLPKLTKLLSSTVVSCGKPGVLSNGFRIGDKFTYGESIIYDCDPGYKLQGDIFRKCEASGQWSGTQARCIGK